MTNPMTPTEQDKELRDKISSLLADDYACTRVWEAWQVGTMAEDDFIPLSETERVDEFMQLIIADRKRVALEARMATLDALDNHKKTLNYIVKDGAPRNHTNYEVYLRKAIEVDTKIAELKAQQEEV